MEQSFLLAQNLAFSKPKKFILTQIADSCLGDSYVSVSESPKCFYFSDFDFWRFWKGKTSSHRNKENLCTFWFIFRSVSEPKNIIFAQIADCCLPDSHVSVSESPNGSIFRILIFGVFETSKPFLTDSNLFFCLKFWSFKTQKFADSPKIQILVCLRLSFHLVQFRAFYIFLA